MSPGATFASDRRRKIVAFGRMIFRVQFLDGSARVIAQWSPTRHGSKVKRARNRETVDHGVETGYVRFHHLGKLAL